MGAGFLCADTHYVWMNSSSPTMPYTNWTTAAHTIQDAVDVATDGDTVIVTNGMYNLGSRVMPGGNELNRVLITNKILVVSSDGPDATVIIGSGRYVLMADSVRCVYITRGTLRGFTLTQGLAYRDTSSGGGAFAVDGTLENCKVITNWARIGGGVYGGSLSNCVVSRNVAEAYDGGGVYSVTANECTISSNSANGDGGGAYESTLNRCTVSYNNAAYGGGIASSMADDCVIAHNWTVDDCDGGGASESVLRNCIIINNAGGTDGSGGGANYSTLLNCVVSGNLSRHGAGIYECVATNCTIVANTASYNVGGALDCTLYNCIVYSNTASSEPSNCGFVNADYCCTTPDPGGTGNITN